MKNMKKSLLRLWATTSVGLILGTLLFLFGTILVKGFTVVNWEFLSTSPKGIPLGTAGGIAPAIVGSFYMGILSGFLSGILGLVISLVLVFYANPHSLLYRLANLSIYFLSGFPSILFGLLGYTLLIYKLRLPSSLLTACITVSVMILPFITLRLIKIFSEEGKGIIVTSMSLGISKIHTIRKILLPHYILEIVSTITLGMAYGMGATAPVMHTGAVISAPYPKSFLAPFMSLPYHLYILVINSISVPYAYGTALVLLTSLLAINLVCRFASFRKEKF